MQKFSKHSFFMKRSELKILGGLHSTKIFNLELENI